jgi:protocatechuate 3,4-dioxygenase, alpha subunit
MGYDGQTPSQTLGPYFAIALTADNVMAPHSADPATRLTLEGRVLDGDGNPIEDALVELWQANAHGRYRHPVDQREDAPLDGDFTGYGRCPTAHATGEWSFETIRPGPVPDADGGWQAPHVSVVVQARGMLNPVFTRLYLSDETEANAADRVLAAVPADRRHTLIAERDEAAGVPTYRKDIRIQGADETVFLDF